MNYQEFKYYVEGLTDLQITYAVGYYCAEQGEINLEDGVKWFLRLVLEQHTKSLSENEYELIMKDFKIDDSCIKVVKRYLNSSIIDIKDVIYKLEDSGLCDDGPKLYKYLDSKEPDYEEWLNGYEESTVEELVDDYNRLFSITDYEDLDEWQGKAPDNEKILISKISDLNCMLTIGYAMKECSIEELERMVRVLRKYIYGDGYESSLTGKKYDVDEII